MYRPRLALCALGLFLAMPRAGYGAEDTRLTDLRQKAAAGDAQAEMFLGEAYSNGGYGLKVDYAQAVGLFQKAAAQNNAAAEADLGNCYAGGMGVPADKIKGFQLLTKAAAAGNAFGELRLGLCYGDGRGVTKDSQKAAAWYAKAARQGNDEAMTRFGLCLQQGIGVPADLRQGFIYLLRAAYDNFGWAQYCVANSYARALFVPKDVAETERWAVLASYHGYNNADEAQLLSWTAWWLSPDQLAAAQSLIKNWKKERNGNVQPASATISYTANQRTTVPLQDFDDHVVVSATVNGHPGFNFLVDTGCDLSTLDDKTAAALELKAGDQFRVAEGLGPDPVLAEITGPASLQLPGITFRGINFARFSTGNWDAIFGEHIDGILGGDLLNRTVVRIDYVHRTIEFINPSTFRASADDGKALRLTREGMSVYLETTLRQNGLESTPAPFLVDTGAGSALELTQRFVRADPALRLNGGADDLQSGIGGNLKTFTIKVAQASLDGVIVKDPAADVAALEQGGLQSRLGVIGGEILRRFDVTIDYPHLTVYLKPNIHFDEPFRYTNSGLGVAATGPDLRTYSVFEVSSGTPGERAGVKTGDILVQFDDQRLSSLTMTQARRLFHLAGRHSLIVSRSGKTLTLSIMCDLPAAKTGT